MERNSAIGIFLIMTGLVILVPVVVQIRDGRYRWREAWGMFVLAGGFMLVGTAYAMYDGVPLRWLALTGLAAVLCGLFVQHKRRDTNQDTH
ncbi:MAG TPA: hypothetical protein VMN60_06045 [Longimicrobiales bacterium]|nr:hypothetical protein [Longimicrobiales bacterium]